MWLLSVRPRPPNLETRKILGIHPIGGGAGIIPSVADVQTKDRSSTTIFSSGPWSIQPALRYQVPTTYTREVYPFLPITRVLASITRLANTRHGYE